MKIYTLLALCFLAFNSAASKKAITDEGDIVVLKDDGTWIYADNGPQGETKIELNPATFTKSDESTFMLKSGKTNNAFWINPKKWSFKKNDNGHDVAEYTLTRKSGDLYGMIISEQVEIKLEDLVDIALNNARNVAPDAKVIKKEYRMVNDRKVIYMEIEGTIQSIKFTYLGYYYSDSSGSIQYLTYTGSNLVPQYRDDIETFLNGFTQQK